MAPHTDGLTPANADGDDQYRPDVLPDGSTDELIPAAGQEIAVRDAATLAAGTVRFVRAAHAGRVQAASEGDRADVIESIRRYADFLESHPDVPSPNVMTATTYHHRGEKSYAASVEICTRFAAKYGAQKHSSGRTRWVTLQLADVPVKIEHTIFAVEDQPDDEW